MFLGVGVSDSAYFAQLEYRRFLATHEIVQFQDESYSRDSVGYQPSLKISRWISAITPLRAGYEHHYKSEHYARSYLFLIPEAGIQTNHTYVRLSTVISPAKFFYRVSNEPFPSYSWRVQPTISIQIAINLSHSLWIPGSLNKGDSNETSSNRTSDSRRNSSRKLRTTGKIR